MEQITMDSTKVVAEVHSTTMDVQGSQAEGKTEALGVSTDAEVVQRQNEAMDIDVGTAKLPSEETEQAVSCEKPPCVPSKRKRGSSPNQQERRKSQRRSSFVRGRLSIQLPAKNRTERDFTQEIDPNLPVEDKLARLYAAALEFSLEKVCRELEDVDGVQQFKIEGREKGNEIIERLTSAGAFRDTTTLKRGLLNPANIEIEEGIARLEAYKNRLEKESDDWDRICNERLTRAEEAASKAKDCSKGRIVTEAPSTLTTEQRAFLENAPKYETLKGFLHKTHKEVSLFVDEIKKKTEILGQCVAAAENFTKNQAHILRERTMDQNVKLKTPRTLLAEFTAEAEN